jgi:uncharacterized protein (DUF4415 family)
MKTLTNEAGDVRELTKSEMQNLAPMTDIFPELTKENITVKAVGRPKSSNPKRAISIRLDSDIVDYFKNTGKGWQGRINAALKKEFSLKK